MGTTGAQPHNGAVGDFAAPESITGPVNLTADEKALLSELLEAERAKLLVEIRHTDHRAYRQGLRQRLEIVEKLIHRCCGA